MRAQIEEGSLQAAAEADARQCGRIVGRNWMGAALVARASERANQGRRSDLAGFQPSAKLSQRKFADVGGLDRSTVAIYQRVWNLAAHDGLVPQAATLAPGEHVDVSHLDAKLWQHYYDRAPIGLHELRHSYVSQLAEAGFSLPEIGDYVGHSSAWMTDRYRHLLAGREAEAAERFEAYLALATEA